MVLNKAKETIGHDVCACINTTRYFTPATVEVLMKADTVRPKSTGRSHAATGGNVGPDSFIAVVAPVCDGRIKRR